jgi:4-amino-4-deoxy-L-arabinose transferase-like glycosyltransferase
LFVFAYAKKLLGTASATLGMLFIAFSPFHVAHTQILHLDGFMGSFMLLSLLAFLSFGSYHRLADLLISGIAAGLSWLTKSPSLVLIPTIGVLALAFCWHRIKSQGGISIKTLWPTIISLVSWAAIAGITFFLLWPAMWIDPLDSLTKVLTSALGYASQGHDLAVFFDGQIFPEGRIGPEFFYFYPLSYLWRSSPVVLIGLPLSLIAFYRRDFPLDRFQSRVTVAGMLLAVIIFMLVMNFGTKKFDRYLIPAYAPLDLISASGWAAFSFLVARKVKNLQTRRLVKLSVLGTAVVLQLLLLLSVYPYYLSYYNLVLGGGGRVPKVMTVGWGEGLDAAARYLNEKPDPSSLRVASWYRNSFLFHFEGQTDDIPGILDQQGLTKVFEADYAVIYIHQWQRELPKILLDRLRERDPEYSVWINGLEYARIYNLNEDSLESG